MVRVLIAALVIVATWTPAANPFALSPEQRERIERGEIVVLDVLPPGGAAAQGGTALARVKAPPERVWRVLVDYRGHRGLYPRVIEASVLEADARHVLVRYVVGVGPFSFGFHVNSYPQPARQRVEWRLAHEHPNDLFRDSWGYWQIEPRTQDVILTYAMAARTILPSFVTRGAERDGLVETLRAVRERAEQGA